jgi:hypothetical protein
MNPAARGWGREGDGFERRAATLFFATSSKQETAREEPMEAHENGNHSHEILIVSPDVVQALNNSRKICE